MLPFFFLKVRAPPEIYPLPLHDALPTPASPSAPVSSIGTASISTSAAVSTPDCTLSSSSRSEEHTSELQSQSNLVCRLLLEKKNKQDTQFMHFTTQRS